jgi:hypothetical protein
MSLNKSAILLTLVLAGTVQADEVKCPPLHGKIQLSDALVYDGSPEEMADLMPDKSKGSGDHAKSSWEVGYIYEAGRNVYLVCKYGLTDSVTVKAEKRVQTCIYRTHPDKEPVEMFCK